MTRTDFRNSGWHAVHAAVTSAVLLIFSFPNFKSFFLAWIALVPMLVMIARRPSPLRAFVLGCAVGTASFYGTCYWLTYSMIHYGGLPTLVAYLLLIPGALILGIFPGCFAWLLAVAIRRWGNKALLLAPVFWTALEWLRLIVTGQLWNAIGYSQAYHPILIQAANWGGIYAVSFFILAINAAIALVLIERTSKTILIAIAVLLVVASLMGISQFTRTLRRSYTMPAVNVVAVQPNVPMKLDKSVDEMNDLLERHWSMSRNALQNLPHDNLPRLVIWPESPMNFTYASDKAFQAQLAAFAKENHTSLLFNSLEPAGANGFYNSALLINEDGRLISQYDKIRLMPFGEYVPLPQWLPGASLIRGMVGDFTPGDKFTLIPFGEYRAGVFICIESAYPWIARSLTNEGADVLINISNDGYLGPTAVMRQHLANVIFRAVENGRTMVRVTNTGLTAYIDSEGNVKEQTVPFQADVRVWQVSPSLVGSTFYSRHGDIFVQLCALITLIVLIVTIRSAFSVKSVAN
ncbi:MAG TPA: apolipoprotein N-acyltransferase [Pyrinomonadaceae bacterium]